MIYCEPEGCYMSASLIREHKCGAAIMDVLRDELV